MKARAFVSAGLILAGSWATIPAAAQQTLQLQQGTQQPQIRQQTSRAPGVLLRGLDKVSGRSIDIQIATGQVAEFGTLRIALTECRYPVGNRAGDAFAGLRISQSGQAEPVFEGWMIASAPALSAMDHPRYDVWVIRCITS